MFVEEGNLITCNYHDIFTDETKLGIFLVLNVDDNNILCCKVTSQFHENYPYYVHIPSGVASLNLDSEVCVSKWYTFHLANIKNVMGKVPNTYMLDVLSQFNKFLQDVYYKLLKTIGGV